MVSKTIAQYRVVERLGSGGMSVVYRAMDELLDRDVALKVFEPTLPNAAARFRAEASALARLSHPGIATLYELVENDGRLVMVMEYVRGQTLQQIVDQMGGFSPRRAAELCMQVLTALQHAHDFGVVHRDLKPGNLMITDRGSIKITDFGIARVDGMVNLTGAGAMMGTPAYMAPEQVLGDPVDTRADLYAMGVVFFRLITGALPFKGETAFEMSQSQVRDAPANARDIRPDLPAWVDDILTRALAKAPDDRFQSAKELHDAFAQAIADAPQSVVPAAVEMTEAMMRPEGLQPVVVPASPKRPIVDIRAAIMAMRPRTMWLTAGVALVLAAAASVLVPYAKASPDNQLPAPPAIAETIPATTPVTTPSIVPTPTPAPPPAVTPAPTSRTRLPIAPAVRRTNELAAAPGSPTNAAPPKPTVLLPPAAFGSVKMLAVDGSRTATSDVVLHFSDVDVSVQSPKAKVASAVLSYQHIAKATYVQDRDPKWDPALSGPAGRIDVSSILRKHWLVLQSAESYLILRLDGDNREAILKAIEERAHVLISRPAGSKSHD